MAETASFLYRDEDEVSKKAKEAGLQEHPGRRAPRRSLEEWKITKQCASN
jgi:hypothetical protein